MDPTVLLLASSGSALRAAANMRRVILASGSLFTLAERTEMMRNLVLPLIDMARSLKAPAVADAEDKGFVLI